jgi:hypothetical protein
LEGAFWPLINPSVASPMPIRRIFYKLLNLLGSMPPPGEEAYSVMAFFTTLMSLFANQLWYF